MNNKIVNLLITVFIFCILYYLYDIYFTIYESMECNNDKTSDYLKQDINKVELKLDNNSTDINKMMQDIEFMQESIENNKNSIKTNNTSISEMGSSLVKTNKNNIPNIDMDGLDPESII